uniref:Olfactory receptor 25 n=1 Tax=Adelphocoris lineolatus TaxID=236346 RepID=A0A2I4PH58_ADELI|nr:olfactory receptor 25 [Adelphocoris lineolatus]
MMLFLGQTVALQMRILSTAAHKLDERAEKMYMKKSGGQPPPSDPILKRRDKILDACYKQAIRQIVEHHLIIQEFYANYNQLGRWPTFLAVLNGSILIAMSIAVVIMGAKDVPSTFISAGELLVAEVMSLWLLCETGEHVSEWSQKLNEGMYNFNWIDISTSNKRLIMIFKEKAKKPLVLMAGGLTPINRDTFGTIMNSAYTYVNLLRASERN